MTQLPAGLRDIAFHTGLWRRSLAAALLGAATLVTSPAGAATPGPIKIAVFEFELEDVSAGASAAGEAPADATRLAGVTDEIRQLFAQSGRYSLVDVGGVDAEAAKSHALRECDGCDAPIALQLGAEQSFVGVVRRISRTEYTVRFRIRDAQSGSVVSEGDSGLRMGADDSWSRGARRLLKDRLLEVPAPQ
jgi:hypothetical protein